jgi:tripartite-type tricarboxylate transporter receptor subunit TctC
MQPLNPLKHNRVWMLGVTLSLSTAAFSAEGYPARPVTVINPYAAGSSTDLMARMLALKFQESLGQPFVVVNRSGGSGVTGFTALANAPADGLTLAYSPLTPLTIQPHMLTSSKLAPSAVAPVCGVAENILGIVVRKDSPYAAMADLIAKARTGVPPNYGSPGPNSGPSLGADDLARSQKTAFLHVPFQGDAPSIQELIGGRLDFSAVVVASASPFVKSGALRLLAVMSTVRHPDYPEVPTFQQLGFPVKQLSYTGIFAPKETPASILDVLDRTCMKVLQGGDLKTFAERNDQVLRYVPRGELAKTLAEQFREQGESLRASGAIR